MQFLGALNDRPPMWSYAVTRARGSEAPGPRSASTAGGHRLSLVLDVVGSMRQRHILGRVAG